MVVGHFAGGVHRHLFKGDIAAACVPLNQDIRLKRGKVHYALLPVWMLHTKWNGKDFLFAMNGQTGRLVGDLPTDMGKFWTTFAAIAVPVTALATLILHIL